ncbi:RNA polymerase sigma factor [Lewinella sp. 4G2]|uniref:RNA polymerase sigma factor n=1 Tax=Lewinella sp. 4G2 TaxID=1803372 RepID=UPI0007B46E09|nr:sigma-70 family RNA polymerase sigma factor [Lewinella sp. 4G2]OAV43899.1 hypothetical protein A3850_005060 [Lewinella sp. 4G2]
MAHPPINEQLIKACRANQRQAQRRLYELSLPRLRYLAQRYLTDAEATQDVLQEAYLSIFQHLDQFDGSRSQFSTWAGRITINKCLARNRRAPTEVCLPPEDIPRQTLDAARNALEQLTDLELVTWLKQMPRDYYLVFNLAAVEGYDHPEIARMLSITPAVSRQRLSRARKWVKRELDRQPDHPLREFFRRKPDSLAAPLAVVIQLIGHL